MRPEPTPHRAYASALPRRTAPEALAFVLALLCSFPSEPAHARTDATVPGVPTALLAEASDRTRVRLSWTAPTDTGGSGTTIVGCRIEYSAPDHVYPGSTETWSVLEADTGSASTSYDHDHKIAPDVRPQYRVSAINEIGAGDPLAFAETTTPAASDAAGNGAPDLAGATANGNRIVITFDEA